MYNEKIEKLIDLALADGELTEKEKQILFKRAEAEGIDLDEFEMVLNAKLFEITKTKNVSAAPKSDKLGDIRKCPACGAIAESFSTRCGDCGTEFRNVEVASSVVKFFEKLDEVEATRDKSFFDKEVTLREPIGFKTILLWVFFFPFMAGLKAFNIFLDKSKPTKWSTTDARKEELIMNFPIPISRETILEFLMLATSKIYPATYFNVFSDDMKYRNVWNKIWLKKIEQIEAKAALSMKNDAKSLEEITRLAEGAKQIHKNNNQKIFILLGAGTFLILVFILISVFSK